MSVHRGLFLRKAVLLQKLPPRLSFLRRSSDLESPGGLYTLKNTYLTPNKSGLAYTVAFENLGDAIITFVIYSNPFLTILEILALTLFLCQPLFYLIRIFKNIVA